MQRGGRAGRDPTLKSQMTVIVERSVFMIKKLQDKSKKAKKKTAPSATARDEAEEVVAGAEAATTTAAKKSKGKKNSVKTGFDPNRTELPEGYEWVKKVDPVVRAFLSWKGCRREFLDQVFGNPDTRKPRE